MRLIDADAKEPYVLDGRYVIHPLRHGRWEHSEYAGVDYYQCSVCGHSIRLTAENYCPNCGAKMDYDEWLASRDR